MAGEAEPRCPLGCLHLCPPLSPSSCVQSPAVRSGALLYCTFSHNHQTSIICRLQCGPTRCVPHPSQATSMALAPCLVLTQGSFLLVACRSPIADGPRLRLLLTCR